MELDAYSITKVANVAGMSDASLINSHAWITARGTRKSRMHQSP